MLITVSYGPPMFLLEELGLFYLGNLKFISPIVDGGDLEQFLAVNIKLGPNNQFPLLSGCDAYNNTVKQEAKAALYTCLSKLKSILKALFDSSLGLKQVTFTSDGLEVLIESESELDKQTIANLITQLIEKVLQ